MCYPGIGFEWSACPHRNEKNEAAREEQEMARISIFQDQDGDHQANLRAMSRKVDGEAEWEFRMNERMEGGLRSGRITVRPRQSPGSKSIYPDSYTFLLLSAPSTLGRPSRTPSLESP